MTISADNHPRFILFPWLFFIATLLGHVLLRPHYAPGHPTRLAATAVLILALAVVLVGQVRQFRALDEFQRHVQLFALGFAFVASLLAVFGIGFLRAEGFFQRADARDLAGVMLIFYFLGLALAWRRYR